MIHCFSRKKFSAGGFDGFEQGGLQYHLLAFTAKPNRNSHSAFISGWSFMDCRLALQFDPIIGFWIINGINPATRFLLSTLGSRFRTGQFLYALLHFSLYSDNCKLYFKLWIVRGADLSFFFALNLPLMVIACSYSTFQKFIPSFQMK